MVNSNPTLQVRRKVRCIWAAEGMGVGGVHPPANSFVINLMNVLVIVPVYFGCWPFLLVITKRSKYKYINIYRSVLSKK